MGRFGGRCAPRVVRSRYRRHIESELGKWVIDCAWYDHWLNKRNSKMSDRSLWTTHIQQEEACGLLWYLKFNLRSSYRLNNIRSKTRLRRNRFNTRNNDDHNTIKKIVWQGTSYQVFNLALPENKWLVDFYLLHPLLHLSDDEAKGVATAAMERCTDISESHCTLTDYKIKWHCRFHPTMDKGYMHNTMSHISLVCNKKSAKRINAEWYLKCSELDKELPIMKEYEQVMLVDEDAEVQTWDLLMVKTEWLHCLDHKMVKCFWDKFNYAASRLSLHRPRPRPVPHPRKRAEPHFHTYLFDLTKADLESSMIATVAWHALDFHNIFKKDQLQLVKVLGGFLNQCWGREFFLTLRVKDIFGLKTCIAQVWESGPDVWKCSLLTEANERKDQYWTYDEYYKNFKCEHEHEDEDEDEDECVEDGDDEGEGTLEA